MVKFTISPLSALALVLPLVADLPFVSATHTNGLTNANVGRRHHARMATKQMNYERSSLDHVPRNAVLAKKTDKAAQKKASSYKIKKRGDGKVCKIRSTASQSMASASASAYSSSANVSTATGTAAYSSAATDAWSSVLPTSTAASSSASVPVENSWAVSTSANYAQASSSAAAVSSSSTAAASPTSSEAATSSTSAAATQTSSSSGSGSGYSGDYSHLIPNGKKAGISGGDVFDSFKDVIGWWYDWSADPQGHSASGVTAMNMIWGAGSADGTDAARLQTFKSLSHTPEYILGYEEPDCAAGSGSAGFDVQTGISLWNEVVGPWASKGSILVAPSMCKQAAESGWLGPFMDGVNVKPTVQQLHINKNSREGIMEDLEHYWNTYKMPMIVTEFACVNDVNGFVPSEDQNEINEFINTIVDVLENDPRVIGYAFSSGYGLGNTWKLANVGSSSLSESGQTYLNAISKYH